MSETEPVAPVATLTPDIPAEIYHRDGVTPAEQQPALSASLISAILGHSPAKALLSLTGENEATAAMLFGRAAHACVLRDPGWAEGIEVVDAADWRTKAAREARDAALAADNVPLLEKDMERIIAMVSAVYENETYRKARVKDSVVEGTITWWDARLGCAFRVRPDILPPKEAIEAGVPFTDYKTCADIADWERTALFSHGLIVRIALYVDAIGALYGTQPNTLFLLQEKEPPYFVQARPLSTGCPDQDATGLSEAILNAGRTMIEKAAEIWRVCRANDKYPGPPGFVQMTTDANIIPKIAANSIKLPMNKDGVILVGAGGVSFRGGNDEE